VSTGDDASVGINGTDFDDADQPPLVPIPFETETIEEGAPDPSVSDRASLAS
jgi:hypothetical protein